MLIQTHWKEAPGYEPWNPAQMAAIHYTGLPGGYSTFYYNRVPNVTQSLDGALGTTYSTGHIIAFILLAAGLGTAIGYTGARLIGG